MKFRLLYLVLPFIFSTTLLMGESFYCGYYSQDENGFVVEDDCEPDSGTVVNRVGFSVDTVDINVDEKDKPTFSDGDTIPAGTYYYDTVTFEKNSKVSISGKVVIYAEKMFIGDNVELNDGGDPSNLFLGVYDNNLIINKESKISATIFVSVNLEIKKDVFFNGLIVSVDGIDGLEASFYSGESVDDAISQTDVDTVVYVDAGNIEIIDTKFSLLESNELKDIGVVEITNSDATPGDISYIEYDENLVDEMKLEVNEFASNGQIIFTGQNSCDNWERFFKSVKFKTSIEDLSKTMKVTFTLKSSVNTNLFSLGASPEDPETRESLSSTLAKWENDIVNITGYYGDIESPINVVTTTKESALSNHVSTGLGVKGKKGDKGQIDWIKDSKQPNGGIAEKIVMEFSQPITDITVGFTGLGSRFIDSAKAVYEFYYRGVLVRSRGTLDRSEDLDGDGYVATNLTTTNLIVDKMIFSIEIEGDNKSNANYSVRYITASPYSQSNDSSCGTVTKSYIVKIVEKQFGVISQSDREDNNITTKVINSPFSLNFSIEKSSGESVTLNKTLKVYLVGDNSLIQTKELIFSNSSSQNLEFNISEAYREVRAIFEVDDINFSSDRFAVRPKEFLLSSETEEIGVDENFTLSILVLDSSPTEESYSFVLSYSGESEVDFELSGADSLIGLENIVIQNGLFTSNNISSSEVGEINLSISEKIGNEFALVDENDTGIDERLIEPSKIDITVTEAKLPSLPSGVCEGFSTNSGFTYLFDSSDLLGGASELNISLKFAGEFLSGSSLISYGFDDGDEVSIKRVGEDLKFYIGGESISIPFETLPLFSSEKTHDLIISWSSDSGQISIYFDGEEIKNSLSLKWGHTISSNGLLKFGNNFDGEFRYIKISTDINEAEWDMNSMNESGVLNTTYPAYYKYSSNLRWNDAKNLCQSRGMELPTKGQLEILKPIFQENSISGEFWTNDEISSTWAYMFRFQNNYSQTWTQSMQKTNYKSVYCLGKSKELPLEGVRDVKEINSSKSCSLSPLSTSLPESGKCLGVALNYNNDSGYLLFDDGDLDIPDEGYKHSSNLRWNDAKNICQARGMKLPKRSELEPLKTVFQESSISGEFWTGDEINSYSAYMFRFQNNYSQTWTQSMQKTNYKSVYCVTDPDSHSLFNDVDDFNLTLQVEGDLEESSTLFSYGDNLELGSVREDLTFKVGNSSTTLLIKASELFDGTSHTLKIDFLSSKGAIELYLDGEIRDVVNLSDWRDLVFEGGEKLYVGRDSLGTSTFIGKYNYIEFETKNNSAKWNMEDLNRSYIADSYGKYTLKIFGDVEPLSSECNVSGAVVVDENESEENISLEENITYQFSITDIGKDSISTKVVGEEFELNLSVRAYQTSSGGESGYKHSANLKWDPAKTICEAKGMRLPKRSELEPLKAIFKENSISGEFWTDDSMSSFFAYMFRFDNDYTITWTQIMQTSNSKSVYCISSKDSVGEEVSDFNFTDSLKVSLVGVDGVSEKTITFDNSKSEKVKFTSSKISKNVGAKVEYGDEVFYSEDNFSIRPKEFNISSVGRVIAGDNFSLAFKALDSNGNTLSEYSETNLTSIQLQYDEVKSSCDLGEVSGDISISFNSGESLTNLNYSEIGEVNFTISEINGSEFAKIDQDDTLDIDRLIEPSSQTIEFNLSKVSSIVELNNSMEKYTYIANEINEMNSSINLRVKAVNSHGDITKNFRDGCYSEDLNLSLPLSIDGNFTNLTLILFDKDREELNITESEINISKDIAKEEFISSGEYNDSLHINFKRTTDKPINPITLSLNGSVDVSNFESNSSSAGDLIFVYARVMVEDKEVLGDTILINYIYEIYSEDKNLDSEIFGEVNFAPNWYRDVQVDEDKLSSKVSLVSPNETMVQVNDNNLTLSNPEGWSKSFIIDIEAPSYMLFNKYDSNLTEGNFEINFYKEENESVEVEYDDGSKIDILNKSLKIPNRRVDW